MDNEVIDCFGDICPIPLLKAKDELKKLKPGERFTLVTDHSCVVQSIEDQFKKSKDSINCVEVMNGVWEIEFVKSKKTL